jgi:hypothetical protein
VVDHPRSAKTGAQIKVLFHAGMLTYWTTVEKRKKEALTQPLAGRRDH